MFRPAEPTRNGGVPAPQRRSVGRVRRLAILVTAAAAVVVAVVAATPGQSPRAAAATPASPIKHVVIVLQENQSFDHLLGPFCRDVAEGAIVRRGLDMTCDGADTGVTTTGGTVPLVSATDYIPTSSHSVAQQAANIDAGKMDGFSADPTCIPLTTCYSAYTPIGGPCSVGTCIPNEVALAKTYAVSDRTFELTTSPSWASHYEFATASLDGFLGDIPSNRAGYPEPVSFGSGWGCDSGLSSAWGPTPVEVPSCIPNASGSLGPNWTGYTGQKAPYVPTIFDRLDAAGLSWKIYGGGGGANGTGLGSNGWGWTICPTFAECLYSSQKANLVPATNLFTDAAAGNLPAFSIVTPTFVNSQHNNAMMSEGDNWIGEVISSLQSSSDWSSTAVLVTWDDCGCFYDHANPLQYNSTWGIREPALIVSPYAKPGYTDSTPTAFAGFVAFAEHTFGLTPLNSADSSAYAYAKSFCFNPKTEGCTKVGVGKVQMIKQKVTPFTKAQKAEIAVSEREGT
jgi:phospholipase C